MRKLIAYLGVAVMGMFQVANANTITVTPYSGVLNSSRWEGKETSQNEIDQRVKEITGYTEFLYKADEGSGEESGVLKDSYETSFDPADDPQDALVAYVTGKDYVGSTAYGLVKDGNQDTAWYLFNLTKLGWNGTEELFFKDFWPYNGAISHVALYGRREPGIPSPDGAFTAALMVMSMLGLGFLARRKA